MNHEVTEEKLPELVQDWADIAEQVISKNPSKPPKAVGKLIALAITEEYGGRGFYLAKCLMLKLDRRDSEILQSFHLGPLKGDYVGLARAHGVSERHVRRIIRRAIRLEVMKRQMPLLPEPEAQPNRR